MRNVDPAWALGAVCLALHLAFNGGYGVFRDELYFIACGLHPAFGYVDQPPLTPLIAAMAYKLFGLAPEGLRLVPALAMSATVVLTARFARVLGGGRFAQVLAGLAVLCAPVLLVDGLLLSTDMLQPLTWLGCSWCIVRLTQTRDARWWVAFGAIAGVSWQGKYLVAFYGAGLAVGVLATPLRRSLAEPWLYVGAALALAIAAPNLIWQAAHGWPFLELAGAGVAGKNVALSPLGLLGQATLFLGPPAAPVWLAGLIGLSATRGGELRALPIAAAVAFAIVYATHGKPYYLTPFAPTAFAAGGVAIERWAVGRAWVLRPVMAAAVGLGGLLTLPLSLPVLSPAGLVAYQRAVGLGPSASATEHDAVGALPQYFADMFGWREMAAEVTRIYLALPDDERTKAVFFGRNYGEAAAVELYGGAPAISGHNAYFDWGPRGFDGSTVITVGRPDSRFARLFSSVTVTGRTDSPWARPMETGAPILVLRNPIAPLDTLWAQLKHFD